MHKMIIDRDSRRYRGRRREGQHIRLNASLALSTSLKLRPDAYIIHRPVGCSCLVVAARVPLFWAGGWRR